MISQRKLHKVLLAFRSSIPSSIKKIKINWRERETSTVKETTIYQSTQRTCENIDYLWRFIMGFVFDLEIDESIKEKILHERKKFFTQSSRSADDSQINQILRLNFFWERASKFGVSHTQLGPWKWVVSFRDSVSVIAIRIIWKIWN